MAHKMMPQMLVYNERGRLTTTTDTMSRDTTVRVDTHDNLPEARLPDRTSFTGPPGIYRFDICDSHWCLSILFVKGKGTLEGAWR